MRRQSVTTAEWRLLLRLSVCQFAKPLWRLLLRGSVEVECEHVASEHVKSVKMC